MLFETALALTMLVGWTLIIVGWAGQYLLSRITKS